MSLLRSLLDPGDWLAVKPQLDPQSPVLQLTHVPDAGEVKLRIWLGLIVLAIVAAVIYFLRKDGVAVFVACGFALFGLLNVVYGVLQGGYSMSMSITPSEVVLDSRTLFSVKDWREPLSGFRGVLLREEQYQDRTAGRMSFTRRYYIVELAHTDAAKTVALHVREGGVPPRDVQEAFARRFNLPALYPDGPSMAERTVAELDRGLKDRGGFVADPGPPPSGVTLHQRDGVTRILVGSGRLARGLGWLWWLLVPVLLGGVAYLIDPEFGRIAGGMAAVLVLVILGLGMVFGGRGKEDERAICIDSERVSLAPPRSAGLPRAAIEQVRVDTYSSHTGNSLRASSRHARLLIESDKGRLEYIGTQSDRKKLEWVRDYLRFRLSTRT